MDKQSMESELYTGRFDDGLLDLCAGIGLVAIGLAWLAGLVALTGAVPALMIPVWLALRKRVTEPRLGRVEFSTARRRAERAGLFQAAGLGVGGLFLVLTTVVWIRRGRPDAGAWAALAPLVPAFLVALGLVVVNVLIGARRFAAYAVALMALAGVVTWWGADPGVYLALAGGALTLWAAGVVARFVATHPDLERE